MLGQGGRGAGVAVHNPGAELNVGGFIGQNRQDGKGVPAPSLGNPDRVDAGRVGNLHPFNNRGVVNTALPINADRNFMCHRSSFARADCSISRAVERVEPASA